MTRIFRKMVPLAIAFAAAAMADPIQMKFTGVEGTAAFGYYVGTYYAQMDGQNISIFCDDFANDVNFGQTWQANLSKITTGSDLSNTRYGGVVNAFQDYQEIAWLDTQFGVQPSSQFGDIHATIWNLFDPTGAPQASSDRWLKLAQDNYLTMNFDNFRVITNVGPVLPTGQVQEFLTMVPGAPPDASLAAPEPASLLMTGAGLLTLGAIVGFLKGVLRPRMRMETER